MNSKQILHNCLNSHRLTVFEDNVIEFNKVIHIDKKNKLDVTEIKQQYELYLHMCHQMLCVVNYLKRKLSKYNKDIFRDLLDTVSLPSEEDHNIVEALTSVHQILEEFWQELEVSKEKGLIEQSDDCFQFLLSRYDCAQFLGQDQNQDANPDQDAIPVILTQ